MHEVTPGKIITFYSYKGGTGRSMALANVAWVLASNGKRVLVVDWDLEAPGLHRFFYPFLDDKELTNSEGVIDFVMNCAVQAMTPPKNSDEQLPEDWYIPHADILRHSFALTWDFGPGTLAFIPAGKQGPGYSKHVTSFNWDNFYKELGGGRFIEAAKEQMKAEYDYVLIDSRTGVSDTSGICTVQLPDILVVCFTLNNQSIEGAAAVAESVSAQRKTKSGAGITIFPIPMRVEKFEKDKLEMAREFARSKFESYLTHIEPEEHSLYWGHVEVFYEPFYAYEEILATFGDEPLQPTSLLASIERITSYLTDKSVFQLVPVRESERRRVLSQYARERRMPIPASISPETEFLFFLSYAKTDLNEYLAKFYVDLSAEIRHQLGLSADAIGFFDSVMAASGEQWPELADYAIKRSKVFVPVYSSSYFHTETCGKEFQYFTERLNTHSRIRSGFEGPASKILPVIWLPPKPPIWKAAYELEYSDDAVPKIYSDEGLYSMMKSGKYASDYSKFIARFAQSVIRAVQVNDNLPEPSSFYSLKDVPNAFSDIRSLEIVMKGWNGLLQRYQKDPVTGQYHWTDNEGDVGFLKDVDAMNALLEPFVLLPSSFVDPPLPLADVAIHLETLLQELRVPIHDEEKAKEAGVSYLGFSADPYPYFQHEIDFVDSAAAVLRLLCNVVDLFAVQKTAIPGLLEKRMEEIASLAVKFLLDARIEDKSGARWSGFSTKSGIERKGGTEQTFANLFFTNCAALALYKAIKTQKVQNWLIGRSEELELVLAQVAVWIGKQYDPEINNFWMDEARSQVQTMSVLYALEVLYTIPGSLSEELRADCAKALTAVVEKMSELGNASALQRDFFHSLPLPTGQGVTYYDDRRYIGAFLSLFTLAKRRDPELSTDPFVHARDVLFQGVSQEWIDEPSNLWDDGRPLICFSQDALLGLVHYTLW